jgi:hypothetical protein
MEQSFPFGQLGQAARVPRIKVSADGPICLYEGGKEIVEV